MEPMLEYLKVVHWFTILVKMQQFKYQSSICSTRKGTKSHGDSLKYGIWAGNEIFGTNISSNDTAPLLRCYCTIATIHGNMSCYWHFKYWHNYSPQTPAFTGQNMRPGCNIFWMTIAKYSHTIPNLNSMVGKLYTLSRYNIQNEITKWLGMYIMW